MNCNEDLKASITHAPENVWNCMKGVGLGIKDIIVVLGKMLKGIFTFITSPIESTKKGAKIVGAGLNQFQNYASTEYARELQIINKENPPPDSKRNKTIAMKAVTGVIFGNLIDNVFNFLGEKNTAFACYNDENKWKRSCQLITNIVSAFAGGAIALKGVHSAAKWLMGSKKFKPSLHGYSPYGSFPYGVSKYKHISDKTLDAVIDANQYINQYRKIWWFQKDKNALMDKQLGRFRELKKEIIRVRNNTPLSTKGLIRVRENTLKRVESDIDDLERKIRKAREKSREWVVEIESEHLAKAQTLKKNLENELTKLRQNPNKPLTIKQKRELEEMKQEYDHYIPQVLKQEKEFNRLLGISTKKKVSYPRSEGVMPPKPKASALSNIRIESISPKHINFNNYLGEMKQSYRAIDSDIEDLHKNFGNFKERHHLSKDIINDIDSINVKKGSIMQTIKSKEEVLDELRQEVKGRQISLNNNIAVMKNHPDMKRDIKEEKKAAQRKIDALKYHVMQQERELNRLKKNIYQLDKNFDHFQKEKFGTSI